MKADILCGSLVAASLVAACSMGEGGREPDEPPARVTLPVATAPARPTLAAPSARAAAELALGRRDDLRLRDVRSSLTGQHLRYQRVAPDGAPVLGPDVSVHLRGDAPAFTLLALRDRPPVTRLDGDRRVSLADASARALAAAAPRDVAAVAGTLESIEPAALPDADAGVARAGYRALVRTTAPAHLWEVWIDGATGAARVRRDLLLRVDGKGMVFRPNPVTSAGDTQLRDDDDATTAALDAARSLVTLARLDGTGVLRGDYADVRRTGTRAQSATLSFDFTRNQPEFGEVNAYYHIDLAQTHLQSLGFSGDKAILAAPFVVIVDSFAEDNSYFDPSAGRVEMGTGGVDDAEDGDVVIHEYGHAVQHDIVFGWGQSPSSGAMGEGFGDLLAALTPPGIPALVDRACVASWDAVSYDSSDPPCLRRVDGALRVPEQLFDEVHVDSEAWSGALWPLARDGVMTHDELLQLVVESMFLLPADASFAQFADALVAADDALHDGAHVDAIRLAMWDGGLDRTPMPPDPFEGDVLSREVALGAGPLGSDVEDSLEIREPGASALRLHFASVDMEANPACLAGQCDNIYLFDAQGRLYAIVGGRATDLEAPAIPGDTVTVRWRTDRDGDSAGFAIDRVDYLMSDPEPDAAPPTPDAGPTADAGGGGGVDADSGGCGCRVPSRSAPREQLGGLLLAAAAVLLARRRWR